MSRPSRYSPDTLEPTPSWRDHAACRDQDPAVFFPKDFRGAAAVAAVNQAKAVCRTCPVLSACLWHALNTPEESGVFGGLDEEERRKLRRRIQRRARKTADREAGRAADTAAS